MLTINFEFRKGIFFIRLIGNLNKNSYKQNEKYLKELITNNKFKYIVVNTNYLNHVDIDGLNYIIDIYNVSIENQSNLVICDKFDIVKRLFNDNIPNIKSELEVL